LCSSLPTLVQPKSASKTKQKQAEETDQAKKRGRPRKANTAATGNQSDHDEELGDEDGEIKVDSKSNLTILYRE
jgi:hypothetical protein